MQQQSLRAPLPRGFWVIWSTVAIDMIGFGIVAPILGRYADRFGASGVQVGLLFASFSLAQMVCAPILGRLSDRVGRKPVIVISLIGTALGSFVTGIAGALWVLFVGRIVDGASGASIAVAQSAVVDLGEPDQRARMLGLLGMAFGVGFVVGPALGGLAALGGPHVPFSSQQDSLQQMPSLRSFDFLRLPHRPIRCDEHHDRCDRSIASSSLDSSPHCRSQGLKRLFLSSVGLDSISPRRQPQVCSSLSVLEFPWSKAGSSGR